MAMRLRTLGRTGLEISEVSFGCGPTAGLMIHGSPAQRLETVGRALELGINYFDTAPGYGESRSEIHLGLALRQCGRPAWVASKIALGTADLADIGGAVNRSVERSLKHLGVRRLDVLQLHNRIASDRLNPHANLGNAALLSVDDVLGSNGVLRAFEALRRKGLVLGFGLSAYGGQMDALARVIDSGEFDALSLHYSLLNRSAWQAGSASTGLRDYAGIGARAAQAGMGVVALRVLEGGLLTQAAPARIAAEDRRLDPEHDALQVAAHALQPHLKACGLTPADAAIRFALSTPQLSSVLIGLSDAAQVEQAAQASAAGPLPDKLL